MFDQMKELMKMQQQAKKIQQKLGNVHIEAEEGGIVITINGNLELLQVNISDEAWNMGKDHVQKGLLAAFQKGLKKAQEIAAGNMKDILGELGLPTNLGDTK